MQRLLKNTNALLRCFAEKAIGWLLRAEVCWRGSEFICTCSIQMVMKAASYSACKLLFFEMKTVLKEERRQKHRSSRLAEHLVPSDSSSVMHIASLGI